MSQRLYIFRSYHFAADVTFNAELSSIKVNKNKTRWQARLKIVIYQNLQEQYNESFRSSKLER